MVEQDARGNSRRAELLQLVRTTDPDCERLGVFFGVDPRNWLNLQRAYDLEEFERTRGAKVRRAVEKWAA